jgi:hypothetical protein
MGKRSKNIDQPTTVYHDHESVVHEIVNAPGGVVVHRLKCADLVSDWFRYQQIARLKTSFGLYHACTDYFNGSLPTNVVFVVSEIL